MADSQNIPILTVSQFTNAIKISLESTFPLIWLQGEVSNSKLNTSGHFYFSLKDAHAQIAAVIWRGDASALKAIPKDGAQVIVCGEINVYPPGGKYQIVVKELRPVGVGELLQKLEELKVKLLKKGYFKKDRKKPLTKLPRRIGLVTSPTGAAIQDILNILTRRFSGFHLILNPVKVQGEGAAQEIAQAIHQFNLHQLVDVMIVGRGGGSIEDLWAFNEEIVADAIYNSRIPIISAVGHETDHCIADYVADVRAPTPSAAAEIVIAEKTHMQQHLNHMQKRLQQVLQHHVRHQKQRLQGIRRQPLLLSPYGILGPWMQKLDSLKQDIDLAMAQKIQTLRMLLNAEHKRVHILKPTSQIAYLRNKLDDFEKTLRRVWLIRESNRRRHLNAEAKKRQLDMLWHRMSTLRRERLNKMAASLHSIDPKNLLTKGYAILFAEKDRSVITSIRAVAKEDSVRALLADGEIHATIKQIVPQ